MGDNKYRSKLVKSTKTMTFLSNICYMTSLECITWMKMKIQIQIINDFAIFINISLNGILPF